VATDEVRKACATLQDSKPIEIVLATVLDVGNYLNGGTSRGQADGFDLIDTLPKLRNLKGSHSVSLLDFLVRQLEREHPGLLSKLFVADAAMDCLNRARRQNLLELEQELSLLLNQATSMAQVLARGDDDEGDPLQMKREEVKACVEHLHQLQDSYKELCSKYAQLCSWFRLGDRPKQSHEVFQVWTTFLADVKNSLAMLQARQVSAGPRNSPRGSGSTGKDRTSALSTDSPPPRRGGGGSRERRTVPRRSAPPVLTVEQCLSGGPQNAKDADAIPLDLPVPKE